MGISGSTPKSTLGSVPVWNESPAASHSPTSPTTLVSLRVHSESCITTAQSYISAARLTTIALTPPSRMFAH